MNKIPTLFQRDWEGDRSRVLPEVVPECEWVIAGEGVPTRKYDGTCCMFDGEKWWARREVKDGKTPPPGFMSSGHDHVTLKNVGWEPIAGSPFAKFHAEALEWQSDPLSEYADDDSPDEWAVGTYELIGPKVQGNPEGESRHALILHASAEEIEVGERSFDGIRVTLEENAIEGIVFHHEDGRRMAKIKKRDFGLKR